MAGQNTVSDGGAQATEASSLLNGHGNADRPVDSNHTHHRRRVIVVTFAMFFFLEFGAGLLLPAQTAALEQKICNEKYSDIAFVDRDCKAPNVQGDLAVLKGWQTMLECVPGLFATIPYGILSNKWGRHRVLSLAFSGITLGLAFQVVVLYFQALPVNLVLLSPMFMFFGGGPAVITAMLYTTIADITPVSARAPIFLQFSALLILSEVASGPLAGLILLKSVWGLIALASVFYILATFTTFFLPDTLSISKVNNEQDTINDNDDLNASSPSENSSIIEESLYQARKGIREIRSFLSGHGLVIIMMFCYVFIALSKIVQIMLLQYTTKRYHWSWSKASFILTIRSIVSLVVLVLVLPTLTQLLTTRYKVDVIRRDVWVARATGVAGVLGSLLIAFAPTSNVMIIGLITFAIHGGMTAVLRSLLSNMVEPRYLGTMNSLLGILEMIGLMIGAPSLFVALRYGFELGGDWVGLPFLCAAGMIALSTAVIFFLPGTGGKRHGQSFHDDEDSQ